MLMTPRPGKSDNPSQLTPDILQELTAVEDIVLTVEKRLLHLIRGKPPDAAAKADLLTELDLLAKEIARSYRRVVEIEERRDIGFKALQRIEGLDHHCVWLYKRIWLEHGFFRKLHFEKILETLISPKALAVYHAILEADELEREALTSSEAQVRKRLLEGEHPGQGRIESLFD